MPLMQPTQNAWVNAQSPFVQSQFANSAQGYQAGNTFATSQPVTAQQSSTSNNPSGSFMSPGLVSTTAKAAGKFVGNGFSLDGILGANPASAAVPASTVGQATETFLPTSFGNNANAFGGIVPDNFGTGSSPVSDIVSSAWKDIASVKGVLGGQAFGANGFAGTLGSSGLDLIGNGIANFGAGFAGNKLGNLIGGGGGYSSIGSTIGGAAGSYFGPAGSFIGSTLGSIVGGLFGGPKPNPAAGFGGIALNADGALTGGTFQGKHIKPEKVQPLVSDLSSYLQEQSKLYGVKLDPKITLSSHYDVNGFKYLNKDPSVVGTGKFLIGTSSVDSKGNRSSNSIRYDFDNPASKEATYKSIFDKLVTLSGQDPTKLAVVPGQAGTAGTSPGVAQGGAVTVKQGTQGSFNAFMKVYRGGTNVQTPA